MEKASRLYVLSDINGFALPAGAAAGTYACAPVGHSGDDFGVLPDPGSGTDHDRARVDDGAVPAQVDVFAEAGRASRSADYG
jgi:hypothetical protein